MCTKERLAEILRHTKTNVKSLSERLGYARPQGLYDVASGRTKNFSSDLARRLVTEFPELSKAWILTGEGEMLRKDAPAEDAPAEDAPAEDAPLILTGEAKRIVLNMTETINQQEANISRLVEVVDRLTGAADANDKTKRGIA